MIHAMWKRLWYVEEYLIPSMETQGIDREQIIVYCDEGEGNLKSCMKAFGMVEGNTGTWHLQDDVIISHDFKEKTEQYDKGVVCGFCSMYDNENMTGTVPVQKMWFSFPCIRIPDKVARGCSEWYFQYMERNPSYTAYTKDGANDDWMFRHYVWDYYKDNTALNLTPNIVDHIDYLIGGTVNSNTTRKVIIRSKYWEDEYLVEELEKKLKYRTP